MPPTSSPSDVPAFLPPPLGAKKHAPFAREGISINIEITEAQVVVEEFASLLKR